jgi:hypothetical protein
MGVRRIRGPAAVDLEQVAGVALEVDAEFGPVVWL